VHHRNSETRQCCNQYVIMLFILLDPLSNVFHCENSKKKTILCWRSWASVISLPTVIVARPQRETKEHLQLEKGTVCGQQASNTAAGRWRWQHRTELDGLMVCGWCCSTATGNACKSCKSLHRWHISNVCSVYWSQFVSNSTVRGGAYEAPGLHNRLRAASCSKTCPVYGTEWASAIDQRPDTVVHSTMHGFQTISLLL